MSDNGGNITLSWTLVVALGIVIVLFCAGYITGESRGKKSAEDIEKYISERDGRLDEMSQELMDINDRDSNLDEKLEELGVKIDQLEELLNAVIGETEETEETAGDGETGDGQQQG